MQRIPLAVLVLLCLTLGLAPFTPEPHIWEKLRMLAAGELTKIVDVFDFLFHGVPWVLLALKLLYGRKPTDG
ncbi:RND transporter [Thalassococcus lentus]|uniref:RND transporter n=1 Tax=Thalassococcus lentus TaxID=1210524 RepID=A0ABT4XVT2_9RHOB|nr:RND transporter [Thalassococcus lentus]MDA7426079.1 RND transporter [Thalassococcus lentus]